MFPQLLSAGSRRFCDVNASALDSSEIDAEFAEKTVTEADWIE